MFKPHPGHITFVEIGHEIISKDMYVLPTPDSSRAVVSY